MIPTIFTPRRQPMAIAVFLVIQTTAAVYFLFEAVSELASGGRTIHSIFETIVAIGLFLGVGFGTMALRQTLTTMKAQRQAIATASGAFAKVISAQFDAWNLTPAERDVAFFALKGLDVAEIAALRGAAPGTVRAQLTNIYSKAEVSGRAQFAAFFVEDLLGQALTDTAA